MVLPDSWLTDIFFGGRRQLIFPSFYAYDGRLSLFSDHLLCRTSAPLCLSLFVSPSRFKWNYSITIVAFFLRITNRISVLLSVNIIIIIFPKTQIIIFYSWFQIWSLSARIITSSRVASAHAQTAGHVRSLHISLITSSHLTPHRANSVRAGEADAGRVQPQLSLH